MRLVAVLMDMRMIVIVAPLVLMIVKRTMNATKTENRQLAKTKADSCKRLLPLFRTRSHEELVLSAPKGCSVPEDIDRCRLGKQCNVVLWIVVVIGKCSWRLVRLFCGAWRSTAKPRARNFHFDYLQQLRARLGHYYNYWPSFRWHAKVSLCYRDVIHYLIFNFQVRSACFYYRLRHPSKIVNAPG